MGKTTDRYLNAITKVFKKSKSVHPTHCSLCGNQDKEIMPHGENNAWVCFKCAAIDKDQMFVSMIEATEKEAGLAPGSVIEGMIEYAAAPDVSHFVGLDGGRYEIVKGELIPEETLLQMPDDQARDIRELQVLMAENTEYFRKKKEAKKKRESDLTNQHQKKVIK